MRRITKEEGEFHLERYKTHLPPETVTEGDLRPERPGGQQVTGENSSPLKEWVGTEIKGTNWEGFAASLTGKK